jgi:hypothetical protein
MSDDPSAREEGFYWVELGQNPPEIAYWERGEWWLAGDAKPWQPDAVDVAHPAAPSGCAANRYRCVSRRHASRVFAVAGWHRMDR